MPRRIAFSHALTPREWEVLRLLAAELRAWEIAERLGICPSTVRTHLESIYEKLGVRGDVGAAMWLVRHESSKKSSP